jgi:uncharacterized protein YjbI with pentapeptide repeats
MRLVKDTAMEVAWQVWQARPPTPAVTVVIKATMDIPERGECTLAVVQALPTGDVHHEDDAERTVWYPSDFAPVKSRAEWMLTGSCFAPRGVPTEAVWAAAQVGPSYKRLVVVGDREYEPGLFGGITSPRKFVSMPLCWERSFGGAKHKQNPAGCGMDKREVDGRSVVALPNIEKPDALISGRRDRPEPYGMFPVPIMWPERIKKAGSYGKRWLNFRYPYLAEDIDWTFFNAAPPDQQLQGFFRGDEVIALLNLHPKFGSVDAKLPGLRPAAFLRTGLSGTLRALAPQLDTIVIDADAGQLHCVWRAVTEVSSEDLTEYSHLFVVHEAMNAETHPAAYQQWCERLLHAEKDEAAGGDPGPAGQPQVTPATSASTGAANAHVPQAAAGLFDAVVAPLPRLSLAPEGAMPPRPPPPHHTSDQDELSVQEAGSLAEPATPQAPADEGWAPLEHQIAGGQVVEAMARRSQVISASYSPVTDARATHALIEWASQASRVPDAPLGRPLGAAAGAPRWAGTQPVHQHKPDADDSAVRAAWIPGGDLLDGPELDALEAQTDADLPPTAAQLAQREQVREAHANGTGCVGWDLIGANLSGMALPGLDLRGALLMSANLTGATLDDAQLGEAQLSDAKLSRTRFVDADLTAADLSGCKARDATWTRARLHHTVAQAADFTGAVFDGTTGVGALWHNVTLTNAVFRDATFDTAEFCGGDLTDVSLVGGSFADADLSGDTVAVRLKADRTHLRGLRASGGVDLTDASLRQCDCTEAKFGEATLVRAKLTGSTFDRADFSGANLAAANLAGCRLMHARFDGATLVGASLVRIHGHQARFEATDLRHADCRDANLFQAEVYRANVEHAVFDGAVLTGTRLE